MNYGLIIGFVLWLASAALLRLPLETTILLFAPLVLLRPAIQLVRAQADASSEGQLLRLAGWLQLPAAAVLAVSFAFPQGVLASALAVPWLLLTLLLALVGTCRLWQRAWRLDGELAISAALLMIAIGGGWAVASRAGLRPQDFSHAIVLLTSVHFHYAGFVLPLLAGLTVQELNGKAQPPRVDRVLLMLILAGVPLVGVGISLSPQIEVLAAIMLAAGCILFAWRQTTIALRSHHPTRLTFLVISSLALVSAMIPAILYAYGEFTNTPWPSIATMIRTHGAFNAFGFATCGLAGHIVGRK